MAYATENRTAVFNIADRLAALRAALADRIARNKVYNQTFRELSAMSSRELADIGINRSMIKSIAIEAAYGTK